MPRYLYLAFCEQTHPRCQGYACDDHIDKQCYTVLADDAFLARAMTLIEQIDERAQENLNATCEEWQANHLPGTECLMEGDEFVGLRWLEHSIHDGAGCERERCLTLQDEVLQLLAEMCTYFGGSDTPTITY